MFPSITIVSIDLGKYDFLVIIVAFWKSIFITSSYFIAVILFLYLMTNLTILLLYISYIAMPFNYNYNFYVGFP